MNTSLSLTQFAAADARPPLKLLPFGGFEVAVLLTKLHDNSYAEERNDAVTLLPATSVRSGWLRSKIMAG
jgi:hypothetical protein